MRVLPPITITNGMLTSSAAPEPGVGEATYNSGTAYALGDKVILGSPTSSVTISNASPAVVTWASHGLPNGTPVVFTTTGALPAGLTAGRIYYVIERASGTFQVSEDLDGAPVVTTSAGSGTHTATAQVHRIYESQQGSNTGHPPAIDDGTWWVDIGPTNRWAMFDLLRNTGTVASSPLTVVLTPGQRVDSLALVGLVADAVTVEITVGAEVVYTTTQSLSRRNTTTWYEYFFGDFLYQGAFAAFDLPPYVDGVITVTMTRATGNVTCGGLLIGRSVYLGRTENQAEDDALNFSVIERDDFGQSVLVPRRSVPRTNQRVLCEKTAVNKARTLREQLNAVPALWSGLDDADDDYFEAVLILGIYKRFTIGLDHPNHAIISLELEEV